MNFKLFDTLGEELDEYSLLKAPKTDIYPQRTPANIDLVVAKSKLNIAEELIAFYKEISSIQFTWNLKKDAITGKVELIEIDDYVCGSINILKFESMIFGPSPEGWTPSIWHSDMSPEEIAEHKPFRPFDFADSRIAAGFMVENGEIKDKVYLYYLADRSSEIFDMEMNLAEYLHLLHKTRGFLGWQVAWIFRNGYEYDFMMHYFPQIFPEVDISEFEKRK